MGGGRWEASPLEVQLRCRTASDMHMDAAGGWATLRVGDAAGFASELPVPAGCVGRRGAPPASGRPCSSRPALAVRRRVSTSASVLGGGRLDARIDLSAEIARDVVVLAGELAHLVRVGVVIRVRVRVRVGDMAVLADGRAHLLLDHVVDDDREVAQLVVLLAAQLGHLPRVRLGVGVGVRVGVKVGVRARASPYSNTLSDPNPNPKR